MKISVNKLQLDVSIGTNQNEREVLQKIFVTTTVAINDSDICTTDQLRDTIDYDQIVKCIQQVFSRHIDLLETACLAICNSVFDQFSVILSCYVLIEKPSAVPLAQSASVELFVQRPM